MRFFATNAHNGKKYPAEGTFWPDNGWHIQIFDLGQNAVGRSRKGTEIFDIDPDVWGRSPSGVGIGPVIEQGWQKKLEAQGWQFPELKEPENIRDKTLKRMASKFQQAPPEKPVESRAMQIVNTLLE